MGFKKGQRYALRVGDRVESVSVVGCMATVEKFGVSGGSTVKVKWDDGNPNVWVHWDFKRCEGDIRLAR